MSFTFAQNGNILLYYILLYFFVELEKFLCAFALGPWKRLCNRKRVNVNNQQYISNKGSFFFERERMSASGGRECRGAAAREGEREF